MSYKWKNFFLGGMIVGQVLVVCAARLVMINRRVRYLGRNIRPWWGFWSGCVAVLGASVGDGVGLRNLHVCQLAELGEQRRFGRVAISLSARLGGRLGFHCRSQGATKRLRWREFLLAREWEISWFFQLGEFGGRWSYTRSRRATRGSDDDQGWLPGFSPNVTVQLWRRQQRAGPGQVSSDGKMTKRRAARSWKRWFSLGFEETSREWQRHMQSVCQWRSTEVAQGNDGEAACCQSIDSCGSRKTARWRRAGWHIWCREWRRGRILERLPRLAWCERIEFEIGWEPLQGISSDPTVTFQAI